MDKLEQIDLRLRKIEIFHELEDCRRLRDEFRERSMRSPDHLHHGGLCSESSWKQIRIQYRESQIEELRKLNVRHSGLEKEKEEIEKKLKQ
jgi:hypothetical protein